MTEGGFKFNFKVGEQPAVEEEASDEFLSGQEDEFPEDEQGDVVDDFSWHKPEDPTIWPPYDPRILMPSEELRATRQDLEREHDNEEIEVAPGLTMLKGRVSGSEAASLLKNQQVSSSDLVPEVYEGGFKLWEGAVDLIHYMLQKYNLNGHDLAHADVLETPLQGKRVLELGCGHGLPGIVALMAGAEVHFQDYNREVLQRLTIPNVLSNMARLPVSRPRGTCRFFAGDWHSVGELLTSRGYGGHYDIILTSESIYSVDSQRRLIECIKQVLQPPLGEVLLAAKSYYFGVGGSIALFKKAVKHDGIFEIEHVYKTTKDVSACMRPARKAGVDEQDAVAAPAAPQPADPAAVASPPASAKAEAPQPAGEGEGDGDGDDSKAGKDAGTGAGGDKGGNVREVLRVTFPAAILPYFL